MSWQVCARQATSGMSWLRYVAVLDAQRIAMMRRADPRLRRTFLSVAYRHGRNPAKAGCVRRPLDLAHHLLPAKEEWRAPTPRSVVKA